MDGCGLLGLEQDGVSLEAPLVLPRVSTPCTGGDMSLAPSGSLLPPLDIGDTASRDTVVDCDPAQAARGVVEKEAGVKEGVEAGGLLERQRTERVSALTKLVVDTAGEVLMVRLSARACMV